MKAHFLPVVLLFGALLVGSGQSSYAQTDADTKHQAVVAIYPLMLQAVQDRNLGNARTLCMQAIGYEPRDPTHRYNLACIESLAGNATAAFAALNQATALGYADARSLQTDADLAAVRPDARFAGIVQAATRNAGGAATAARPAAAPAGASTIRPVGARPAAAAAVKPPASPAAPKSAALGAATPPVPAKMMGNKPVGLFFMTRYWIATGSLEKRVWYFAPDGRVYWDPTGFSAAELAAHRGTKGTYQVSGNQMTIKWSDGTTTKGEVEAQARSFGWDMGLFSAVKPFTSANQLVGSYEGGESVSSGSGSIITSNTIRLNADGTFSRDGVASVKSVSSESTVSGGSQSKNAGRWQWQGYYLTLTDGTGKTTRGITFPFDDEKTKVFPDRLYFNGTMFKRQ
ncbi:hypothetical protein F0P96_02855 [Hymenobacter busanensis]|uniref:Uncharacterized protein n=1 Tax=Hymenobacter busanensis TaxID=2607656 RepID=A0A7L4ZV33_9BACT|nr:hypothetical protein [Hymenobacter busanensis]KAA9339569.1 hypothetical protein F0P96_02855 [Hymenobacter busanensis]QHJ06676.1 hypothetical protein GUY19_04900 [Hymenobacter busanensis]